MTALNLPQNVTQASFARLLSVSRQTVADCIRNGRLSNCVENDNGKISIDLVKGCYEWIANRNAYQDKSSKISKKNEANIGDVTFKGLTIPDLSQSQRVEKYLDTETKYRDLLTKDISLEKEADNLLPKDQIQKELYTAGSNQRDLYKSIVNALSKDLANKAFTEEELREIVSLKFEDCARTFCDEIKKSIKIDIERLYKEIGLADEAEFAA